jgi:hypothetical protein
MRRAASWPLTQGGSGELHAKLLNKQSWKLFDWLRQYVIATVLISLNIVSEAGLGILVNQRKWNIVGIRNQLHNHCQNTQVAAASYHSNVECIELDGSQIE